MNITKVEIYPVLGHKLLKAYCTIVLDDCFLVRDLKVIARDTSFFVSMPSKKLPGGKHVDLAHPLDPTTRAQLEARVLQAYQEAIAAKETEARTV